ncbi:MAG TPA: hypothetical protein PLD47_02230 [Aggregatilineales bacterium]|nr:hypothetical protein [Anaerolineales bacterium]HRE46516.1 hypothetical protein [Aggregatilineales bacterium]
MSIFEILARIVLIAIGVYIVLRGISSAMRTFVLPRAAYDPIVAALFRAVARLFRLYIKVRHIDTYEGRDRVMAIYAPVSLLLLPTVWLTTVLIGFLLIYWALGIGTLFEAFSLSGSSLLTLGFALTDTFLTKALVFLEATIGITLTAILISYLPTIYSAFSRRESAVAMLEVRAGSPPFVQTLVERYHGLGRLDKFVDLWKQWEVWFAELEETHTSLVALVWFRSPQPHRHWVTAAGAVLDSASFIVSALDLPRDPDAQICIRSGFIALRRIADFFGMEYNPDPKPDDPISITRSEFDIVYKALADAGVAMRPDRDQAWRDFAGWRVNYDTVLLSLAAMTIAPYGTWSSDRSVLHTRRSYPIAQIGSQNGVRNGQR